MKATALRATRAKTTDAATVIVGVDEVGFKLPRGVDPPDEGWRAPCRYRGAARPLGQRGRPPGRGRRERAAMMITYNARQHRLRGPGQHHCRKVRHRHCRPH
jgi:hypothetical protein